MEREEAIEVVKKNYPYINDSISQFETALRTLIPELAESEDERIRKAVIDAVKTLSDSPLKVKMLAWLEKQGEQKPAEWSDEDEKISSAIIKRLSGSDALSVGLQSAICWVENVKYRVQPQSTWKPSDEQMNLLEELVEDNNQRYFYTILRSLYEQLKKLREE